MKGEIRRNAKIGFYATGHPDSQIYAAQVPNAGVAYLDLDDGEYEAWAPAGASGEHFRWCYLPKVAGAPAPTIVLGDFPAPTPASANQAPSKPAAAQGAAWAPANASSIRIAAVDGFRIAMVYSGAGPVNLNLTRVL